MRDDEFLMISALTHLQYCERRFALVHIEQLWTENLFTMDGRNFHEKVHSQEGESRGEIRIERGLRVRSLKLGLFGVTDVVEFHHNSQIFPIEYKRGKEKADITDSVQLCAQAMCLEEMLGVDVPRGAIFYGQPRRRTQVEFDNELRSKVVELCEQARHMIETGVTPPPRFGKHCKNCSLVDECMPEISVNAEKGQAEKYIQKLLKEIVDETIA
jgi:CRISPR-associated exonuclease Cas4